MPKLTYVRFGVTLHSVFDYARLMTSRGHNCRYICVTSNRVSTVLRDMTVDIPFSVFTAHAARCFNILVTSFNLIFHSFFNFMFLHVFNFSAFFYFMYIFCRKTHIVLAVNNVAWYISLSYA